ncbi:MAG: FHA domain-containing protein [Muribaculaceae bacterium]|nr:FHA domain-containing protein [Muribaculaceae bacterium]
MSRTIIIGRAGEQPFYIPDKYEHVSREHARITIPDNPSQGEWLLEDIGSSHGTRVRDEDGEMRKVEKTRITPLTYILLGDGDYGSYGFYACHVLTPESYTNEWKFMMREAATYDRVSQQENKAAKWKKMINRATWPVFIGADIITEQLNINFGSPFIVRTGLAMICAAVSWWVTRDGRIEAAKRRWNNVRRCPNPECRKNLDYKDITVTKACPYCHCHI